MSRINYFPEPLRVEAAHIEAGSRHWKLLHYYRYVSSIGTITVCTGFLTDLASIPKAFRNIFDPAGPWMGPAVIHDYLYTKTADRFFPVTRKQADDIFKEAMFNIGIGFERNIIWAAVRIGGWKSWKKR